METLKDIGKKAKQASFSMAQASTEKKNLAIQYVADNILSNQQCILEANQKDVAEAKAEGIDESMLDRLSLTDRLDSIAEDTRKIMQLPDPVGEEFDTRTLDNGLILCKRRTPIGVLGVIYEARPNVTVDVATLAIKTGNCAILRGGSETLNSNRILVKTIQEALQKAELPVNAIQFIDDSNRKLVLKLLHLHQFIDMIIPRGGAGLHSFCREHSQIPVITGGIGICHLFVDDSAHLEKALEVIFNAKTQRPTVCNALDTLLVHQKVAEKIIPRVINQLSENGVSFRLDQKGMEIALKTTHQEVCHPALDSDWDTEWLRLILGVRVVENLEKAIEHIRKHSTGHSDGILTETKAHAERFVNEVDSSAVYVNASTRFTDGSQFGLGAEVAISTQKLHARGPMGLEELTTYKWVVRGDYQVRS